MRFANVSMFAAALALIAPLARAQDCGSNITTDTVLSDDIGPCPGNGLTIEHSGITLDLNGHQILGSGSGTGIAIAPVGSGAVIKNGTISNFGVGIGRLSSGALTVTISDLSILSCGSGIFLSQATARIVNNVITGKSSNELLGTGIGVSEGNYRIKWNQISGFSVGAQLGAGPSGGTFTFSENQVSGNKTGVQRLFRDGTLHIRCNMITGNLEDGVVVAEGSTREITNNHVDSNGRSGIRVIAGGLPVSISIEDNSTGSNGLYGIEITGLSGGSRVSVIDNLSQGNSTDIFWDSTGQACFLNNTFDTSSPPVLPSAGCGPV